MQISDGTNDDPEPDLPPESTYIDGVYPVTVLCLPDADMDFEAYNLFAQVTIQDDKIIKIDNVYGDGGSGNDSYINKAVNGTSSKTGVVKQIIEGGRDYEVTVDFKTVGVKKMFASFAKLKKL